MTVESNYVIAIATLSDWLKRLAPVFQPMKTNVVSVSSFDHHIITVASCVRFEK